MKHTPGPWIHRTRLDDGANIGCKDGYAICDMAYKYSSISREELEADANLIVAAPDLLQALDTLLNRIELEGCTPLDWPSFKAGRKAIAKAIGATP